MSPSNFLKLLFELAPQFKSYWNSDNNDFINENGTYNFHGICAEFSHYLIGQEIEKQKSLTNSQLKALFELFESNVEANENINSLTSESGLLSNAICTCFLENISQTTCGEYASSFMGEKSKAYFVQWHSLEKKL